MNVHFQCVIQVCRFNCPEPNCPNGRIETTSKTTLQQQLTRKNNPFLKNRKNRLRRRKFEDLIRPRVKRHVEKTADGRVPMTESIRVLNGADIASDYRVSNKSADMKSDNLSDSICMSLMSFTTSTGLLIIVMISSCITTTVTCKQINKNIH